MDMTRYEKIDGREALRRLLDGHKIYNSCGHYWEMAEDGSVYFTREATEAPAEIHLNLFSTNKYLFIKKPFDVRQAMRDKPDEWVGAYERNGRLYKVGFDSRYFRGIEARFYNEVGVDFTSADCSYVEPNALDDCIPLDEVPEDAK